MERFKKGSLINSLFLFPFLLLVFCSTLLNGAIAQVTYIEGNVLLTNKLQKGFKKVPLGLEIVSSDIINTYKKGKVKLVFNDGTIIVVGKNSTFSVENYLYDNKKKNLSNAKFKLSKGLFKVITGAIGKLNPDKFKLKTATATIGIRGTTIYADQKRVAFTQGKGFIVDLKKRKQVSIKAGQMSYTLKGKVPTKPIPITKNFQQVINYLDRGTITKIKQNNTHATNLQKNSSSLNNIQIQNSNLNTNVKSKNINIDANGNAKMGSIEIK